MKKILKKFIIFATLYFTMSAFWYSEFFNKSINNSNRIVPSLDPENGIKPYVSLKRVWTKKFWPKKFWPKKTRNTKINIKTSIMSNVNTISMKQNSTILNMNPAISSYKICNEQNDWEKINQNYFFKKDAIFFFNDKNLLRIYGVGRYGRLQKYNIIINGTIKGRFIFSKTLVNITQKQYISCYNRKCSQTYKLVVLEKEVRLFDLLEMSLNTYINKNLILTIQLLRLNRRDELLHTSSILMVKTKLLFRPWRKKSPIICSRSYEFDGRESLINMESWIKLNKKIGYEKIVLYNDSIVNNEEFSILFRKYSDFIEVRQTKCFPNLFDDHAQFPFLKKVSELQSRAPTHNSEKIFEQLFYNECFYDYYDTFQIISIFNNDEVLIPKFIDYGDLMRKVSRTLDDKNITNKMDILDEFACPRLTIYNDMNFMAAKMKTEFIELNNNVNNTNYTINSNNTINVNTSINSNNTIKNIYFMKSVFIPHNMIDIIFDKIDEYVSNKTRGNTLNSNEISFKDEIKIYEGNVFKLSFAVTKNEFDYAVYLNSFYRQVVRPFLKLQEEPIKKLPEFFKQLFYVYDNKTAFGKTFYLTNETDRVINTGPPKLEETMPKSFIVAGFGQGRLSNFNKFTSLHKNIPIRWLNFDYDYFSCYFRNLIELF